MDLFFIVSKVAGLLFVPSNLIVILLVAGGVLWRFVPRARTWGQRMMVTGASAFVVLALLPVGDFMLAPMERRFPRIEECTAAQTADIGGIIVLGGGLTPQLVDGHVVDEMNEASDRLRHAAKLAQRYPEARVLVSGGQAFENGSGRSEADAMAALLMEFGVAQGRIVREANSRTTAQNADFVAAQVGTRTWLLVTSAFHMPRAMGSFRKAGLGVIAAPTDWRGGGSNNLLTLNAAHNLETADLAAKEYLGLIGYWITRRTDALFPGPEAECG